MEPRLWLDQSTKPVWGSGSQHDRLGETLWRRVEFAFPKFKRSRSQTERIVQAEHEPHFGLFLVAISQFAKFRFVRCLVYTDWILNSVVGDGATQQFPLLTAEAFADSVIHAALELARAADSFYATRV